LLPEEFRALLRQIEGFLRRYGREVYAGKVSVLPFRLKNDTACDFCDYRPICRFDPWTQPYRVLRPPEQIA
jgi:ATP-dependent helicase/nuclease subunit B